MDKNNSRFQRDFFWVIKCWKELEFFQTTNFIPFSQAFYSQGPFQPALQKSNEMDCNFAYHVDFWPPVLAIRNGQVDVSLFDQKIQRER